MLNDVDMDLRAGGCYALVGGSGSGKTRFFVKPNIMQCTKTKGTSLVVTDPKGQNLVSCPCAGRL